MDSLVERKIMPITVWLRGHADGIRKQCEGKPLGGQYPVVPYTAQRLDEAAAHIATLEADNARLRALAARFEAPSGNLFSYVAELEGKLALLERQADG